ncbi:hypothetical protein VTN00DRAFT_9458 [Thermoascus crustaceus]|uniref:uncharacterized protein n=1 Tax=Thermoascus crustaceus TaxID=5088 RepID=UPI00374234EB
MSTSSTSSPAPVNPQVTYLRNLQRSKGSLPHGQLVCVSASHTITNTDCLLQLASAVGPHIAIFQVHADLIDDWSEETANKLIQLAKKHAFLIWEGGRILNSSVNFVGKQRPDSRVQMKNHVDRVRKTYTKGHINMASWAGLVTAWPSGVAVDSHEVDILIPALKSAARETVAEISQTITTEITAEGGPIPEEASDAGDDDNNDARDEPENEGNRDFGFGFLSPDSTTGSNGTEYPWLSLRKGSVISLTQTITQHTEPSEPSSPIPERHENERNGVEERRALSPINTGDVLSPPLLARGLVLCLPSTSNTLFAPEYRRSCLIAARTNRDFVIGFMCNEPWTALSLRDDVLDGQDHSSTEGRESRDEHPDSFVVFSTIPVTPGQLENARDKNRPSIEYLIEREDDEEAPSPVTVRPSRSLSDALNPQAALLHAIIEQALACRKPASEDNKDTARTCGRRRNRTNIIHVPIVTLGL